MSLLATRRKLLRSRRGLLMAILQGTDIAEVVAQPTYSFNFISNNSLPPGATFIRNTVGNFFGSNGLLQSASANVLRRDYGQNSLIALGALIEEARTNQLLWNRDFTQVPWVKTTMTAALDQIGIDGINNSASSLTALAGNALALQTIVDASLARAGTIFVKRITGTGAINITQDGVSFTALSPAPSSTQWTRYELDATQANPVFGLQIVTGGDKIAVDYSQLEPGAFATSPIFTTAAAVTRNADILTVALGAWFNPLAGVLFWQGNFVGVTSPINRYMYAFGDGSTNNVISSRRLTGGQQTFATTSGGVTDGSVTGANLQALNISHKYAANYSASLFQRLNGLAGGNGATDPAYTTPVGLTTLNLGSDSVNGKQTNGHIAQISYYNTGLTPAQLVELTT